MNDGQFRVLRSFYAAVASVADAFGSEATSSGLVLPVPHKSLAEARLAFLPEAWTIHALGFDAFIDKYAKPAHAPAIHAFVEFARHFQADASYVAPSTFDRNAHSRGAFTICLFLNAKDAAGANILVVFERVET